jgi:hypothetical protein
MDGRKWWIALSVYMFILSFFYTPLKAWLRSLPSWYELLLGLSLVMIFSIPCLFFWGKATEAEEKESDPSARWRQTGRN